MAAEQLQPPYLTDPGYSPAENAGNNFEGPDKSGIDAAQGYVAPPGYPHQPPAYQQTYTDPAPPPPSYNTTSAVSHH